MRTKEGCIFCDKNNISTEFVYEDDQVMAFLDFDPINEGHVLLVPKEHYLDVDEMPDELLSHLMLVSKKIAKAIKETYSPDGYSIMQNGGEFNDIGHYHLHIFPRFKGDGFGWTTGEGKKSCGKEVAAKLRAAIER